MSEVAGGFGAQVASIRRAGSSRAPGISPNLFLLALLGAASWLCYLAALGVGDLRRNTLSFELAYFGAFSLYLAACALALRPSQATRFQLLLTVLFALLFRLTLLPSGPSLSDDMYRYVWDGRVQNSGLSPYRYPPNAPEVAHLRRGDRTVWRFINRKEAVTVYPPGAQAAYAAIWRLVGDSVSGFKAVFVAAELLGGALLAGLLKRLGQPPERILIYLWSPLLIVEVAHAGHVDGLMLPLLVAAFWARAAGRPWALGALLGVAALVKLFPAILLPALLPIEPASRGNYKAALKTLLAFTLVAAAGYAAYARHGIPIGFLPNYFNENFNMGLARLWHDLARPAGLPGSTLANVITFGGLAVLGMRYALRPAASPQEALTRSLALIGWFTLTTQNLFAWYLLWLLPLLAVLVEPGPAAGFRLSPATAWLVFTGTVALSYLFFIDWRVVAWGQIAEYLPLYALLIGAWAREAARAFPARRAQAEARPGA